MKIILSVVVLLAGAVLCLMDVLSSVMTQSQSIKLYAQELKQIPPQQSYTRAEYTAAAWRAWTNRVHLPNQPTYTSDELKDYVFGLGTYQTSCDRATLESLIGQAVGLRRREQPIGLMPIGVITMLAGAFLFGLFAGKPSA